MGSYFCSVIQKLRHVYRLGDKTLPSYLYALQAWSVLEARDLYPDLPFEFWGDKSMIDMVVKTKLSCLYTSIHLLPDKDHIDTGLFWAMDKMRLCGPNILMIDTDAVLHTQIDDTRLVVAHLEDNPYMPIEHYTPNNYKWPEWYNHNSTQMFNTSLLYFPHGNIFKEWLSSALAYASSVTFDIDNAYHFVPIKYDWELICLIEQKFLYDLVSSTDSLVQYAKHISMPEGQKPYSHLGFKKTLLAQEGKDAEDKYCQEKILANVFNLRHQYFGRVMDIEKRAR